MKQVKTTGLSIMRNEELFGIAKFVCNEVETNFPDDPEEGIYPLAEPRTSLINSFKIFDDYMNQPRTDSITKLCQEWDDKRTKAWRNSYDYTVLMNKYPGGNLDNYPQEVLEIYLKYGNPSSLSQTEKTSRLHNLLQDLKAYMAGLLENKFDYKPWLDELERCEDQFEEVEHRRAEEKAKIEVGAVDKARKDCEKALKDFLDMVNVVVKYQKTTDYDSFIDNVNNYISRQLAFVKSRSTKAQNKKKEEEAKDNTDDKLSKEEE